MNFIDLPAQYRALQPELEEAVLETLRSGNYIMGQEVVDLENNLARFAGSKYCVSCSSGTDALVMALMALGIGYGDAVLCPSFTFVATAEAVAMVGAVPIFVDVDPQTFNVDVSALQNSINKFNVDRKTYSITDALTLKHEDLRLKAIISVDLFGRPCDYDEICALAAENGLKLIVDSAQGFGSTFKGKSPCLYGDIACTSFFPAKPLGCYGDGGALFTDDMELFELLKSIRVHGMGAEKYENVRLGLTARLDTVQAAILNVKLSAFPKEIIKRKAVAAEYNERIAALGRDITCPLITENFDSVWAQYTIVFGTHAAREAVKERLASKGIPSVVYYPKPLHLQGVFKYLQVKAGEFPVSESLGDLVLSLPMHPYLTSEDICTVVEAIGDV